uniref:(northern house mosquito) hypothetical protein n=1 Tax=Culex pipiens TaxID=7175 RepID=A0A8D8KZV5_CULPI
MLSCSHCSSSHPKYPKAPSDLRERRQTFATSTCSNATRRTNQAAGQHDPRSEQLPPTGCYRSVPSHHNRKPPRTAQRNPSFIFPDHRADQQYRKQHFNRRSVHLGLRRARKHTADGMPDRAHGPVYADRSD